MNSHRRKQRWTCKLWLKEKDSTDRGQKQNRTAKQQPKARITKSDVCIRRRRSCSGKLYRGIRSLFTYEHQRKVFCDLGRPSKRHTTFCNDGKKALMKGIGKCKINCYVKRGKERKFCSATHRTEVCSRS